MTNSQSKICCRNYNLPLCWACEVAETDCQILFYIYILNTYDGNSDKIKEYIVDNLKNGSIRYGINNPIHLRKSIELCNIQYIDLFDKLAQLL